MADKKSDKKCEEKPARNASQSDAGGEEKCKDEDLGKPIGKITHYYSKLGVGIIDLAESLKAGDKIKIKGHSTDIEQAVDSIQINHEDVKEAKKGDVIGIKVSDHVREGDKVYAAK